MKLSYTVEHWPLLYPFRISGRVWTDVPLLVVELTDNVFRGHAETYGIDYREETPETMAGQLEGIAAYLSTDLAREDLYDLLPIGGARNGLDCALWDLEAKRAGRPVWRLAGLDPPGALLTTFTIGAADPQTMADRATQLSDARALKLKLIGDDADADRIRAVRRVRPDISLYVDANMGLDVAALDRLTPALVETRVELLEQPFPADRDSDLDGWDAPVRLAADESFHDLDDLAGLVGRYQVANIKLDKCGGLTRALEIAAEARRLGIEIMVGNMLGTSLGMAPAFLVGQAAAIVDLDGPTLLKADRAEAAFYEDGRIMCSDNIWGGG